MSKVLSLELGDRNITVDTVAPGPSDRYGCIAGFPDRTYKGDRALTRYEFAAGLNSCLNQMEKLIAKDINISSGDLDSLQRLTQDFEQLSD